MAKYFMGTEGFVWWQGVVEDIDDPMMIGRARVRVLGFHGSDVEKIPTEDLPWAMPVLPLTDFASPTGLKYGDWVVGWFRDGMDAQEPVIMGKLSGVPSEPGAAKMGFKDNRESFENPVPPDGLSLKTDGSGSSITEGTAAAYPINLEEQTTPREARNDDKISESIIQQRKDDVQSGIATALGGTFDEPTTAYDAKYPYNNVIRTESGHVIEYDDTPGAERIHIYHRSGSFDETGLYGTKVSKVVNDKFTFALKDMNHYTGGDSKETINKGKKLKVTADMEIEIGGNEIQDITGDKTQTVGGKTENVSSDTTTIQGSIIYLN